jgi:hypothetical protein
MMKKMRGMGEIRGMREMREMGGWKKFPSNQSLVPIPYLTLTKIA